MKRLVPFLLFSVFLASCSDGRTPTTPVPTLDPSFEEIENPEDPSATRISLLIKAIEPPPGQLNATEKRWESIQRQMALGEIEAAREQMLALADKAVDFYEKGTLLVLSPSDSDLPDSTVEAVAELVMRLFVYVELPSSGAADRYPTFFDSVFDGGDSGFGVLVPDEPTIILTDNGWAAVAAPAGATDEPVYVTLELKDADYCDPETDLIQARGCWEINRVPEGSFNEEVQVEICVDPNTVPEDLEPFILLHKKDEDTGEVTALPWADPLTIDCTLFPVEETVAAEVPPASSSFLGSIGRVVSRLLLPDPLYASFFTGRPPLGIGGLTGSFTDFFGAVPEYSELTVILGADSTTLGVAATLDDAMKLILPGGTILMGGGTHVVEDVVVDKPITLDEVSDASATIRNEAGLTSLRVDGPTSGTVTIQNLAFENNVPGSADPGSQTSSIKVEGAYADVIILLNEFTNVNPNAQSAIRVDPATVATAQVIIRDNDFTGGKTGVVVTGEETTAYPFVIVDDNDFDGFAEVAVQLQTSAEGDVTLNRISNTGLQCIQYIQASSGEISGNTLVDCGIRGGIRVFGGAIDVLRNEITDTTSMPDPVPTAYYHNGIRFTSNAQGTIDGNVINGCGWGGCIQVSYGSDATVSNNTVNAIPGQDTEFGILVFGGYDPATAQWPTARVTDNVFSGSGHGPGTRSDNSYYAMTEGGILVRNGTVEDFSGNEINNATWGIDIYENGTIESGSDNVVSLTHGAIISALGGEVWLHGSDLTDYILAIRDGDNTLAGSVSCNWWGFLTGPDSLEFPSGTSVEYIPWTDGPVAGTGTGSCALGADPGPFQSWGLTQPSASVILCDGTGLPGTCGGEASITLEAWASYPSSEEVDSWDRVDFFWRPAGSSDPPTLIGSTSVYDTWDNGLERFYSYEMTFAGDGSIPTGPLEVFAVGHVGTDSYPTLPNIWISLSSGTPVG